MKTFLGFMVGLLSGTIVGIMLTGILAMTDKPLLNYLNESAKEFK